MLHSSNPVFFPAGSITLTLSLGAFVLTHRVISARSVQRGYVGNFIGELFSKQGHLGAALAGWYGNSTLLRC